MIPWLLVAAAWAAPLTLEEARRLATERALAVEQAVAEAEAAEADAGASFGGTLPAVAGFASLSTGAGRTSMGFERPVQTLTSAGLSASWTVVDPAGWAGARAARRSAEGKAAMADWARLEARREATAGFTATLAAQEEVAAWSAAEQDALAGAAAVRGLVGAGLRPPADLARAEAEAARVRAERIAAEGRAAARCAELWGLLRREVGQPCELAAPGGEPAATPAAEHPALRAAQSALDAARETRRSAAWDLAPTVSATGTAAEYAPSGGEAGPGWSVGLGVELPLFAGGAARRSLAGDQARERAGMGALEEQAVALEVARVSAAARLDAAQAALEARRESLRAAGAANDLVEQRYTAGLTGMVDLIEARRAEQDAAVTLARARAELGAALAEVEAAAGVW